MAEFTLYGGNGKYRMPNVPNFPTREAALEYGRHWNMLNGYVSTLPVKKAHPFYQAGLGRKNK